MKRMKTRWVALVVALGLMAPGVGTAAELELTSVWNGINRSFDERTKSRNFGAFSVVILAEGPFPDDRELSIVCTASVFDRRDPNNVRAEPRKGVRLKFKGKILDGLNGATLQVLRQKKVKTNKDGRATLEFSLERLQNFYAVLDGSLKRKKLTIAIVECAAGPVGGLAGRSRLEEKARRRNGNPSEVTFGGLEANVSGPFLDGPEDLFAFVIPVPADHGCLDGRVCRCDGSLKDSTGEGVRDWGVTTSATVWGDFGDDIYSQFADIRFDAIQTNHRGEVVCVLDPLAFAEAEREALEELRFLGLPLLANIAVQSASPPPEIVGHSDVEAVLAVQCLIGRDTG